MRRGCISLGQVKCDDCQRIIPYPERYLAVDEENGVEVDRGGRTMGYCIDCCLKKGYAHYVEEKGQQILTFFKEIERL